MNVQTLLRSPRALNRLAIAAAALALLPSGARAVKLASGDVEVKFDSTSLSADCTALATRIPISTPPRLPSAVSPAGRTRLTPTMAT